MRLRRLTPLTLMPILRGRRHNRPEAGRNSWRNRSPDTVGAHRRELARTWLLGIGERDREFLPLAVSKSLHGVEQDTVMPNRHISFVRACCHAPLLIDGQVRRRRSYPGVVCPHPHLHLDERRWEGDVALSVKLECTHGVPAAGLIPRGHRSLPPSSVTHRENDGGGPRGLVHNAHPAAENPSFTIR